MRISRTQLLAFTANLQVQILYDGQCGLHAIFDASDEAVTPAGQGLDVAGFFGRIAQHVAQLLALTVSARTRSLPDLNLRFDGKTLFVDLT
jgi:hypothetical protein